MLQVYGYKAKSKLSKLSRACTSLADFINIMSDYYFRVNDVKVSNGFVEYFLPEVDSPSLALETGRALLSELATQLENARDAVYTDIMGQMPGDNKYVCRMCPFLYSYHILCSVSNKYVTYT